jgi:hypothetical protein
MKKTNLVIVLTAGYLLCQIIADVTASKMVDLFGIYVPAAVFIYALTFTLRDVVHKQLGKQQAVFMVLTAGGVNVLMAAYFMFTVWLKPAPFWGNQEAYNLILGVVPRVVGASILAEMVSELIDTEVYHRIKHLAPWKRVLGSNAVSLPIDSLIFVSVAFAGTMPLSALISVMLGQILLKAVITVISIPLIYIVPDRPIATDSTL